MSDKEKLNASGVENGSTDDLKNKNAASPEANEEKASASESSVKADFSQKKKNPLRRALNRRALL